MGKIEDTCKLKSVEKRQRTALATSSTMSKSMPPVCKSRMPSAVSTISQVVLYTEVFEFTDSRVAEFVLKRAMIPGTAKSQDNSVR